MGICVSLPPALAPGPNLYLTIQAPNLYFTAFVLSLYLPALTLTLCFTALRFTVKVCYSYSVYLYNFSPYLYVLISIMWGINKLQLFET